MTWILPRLLLGVASLLVLGLCGHALAQALQLATGGDLSLTLGGALLGLLLVIAADAVRAGRLLRWLRQPDGEAPRMGGPWGDVAYRMERALRSRDQALGDSGRQLDEFLSAIEASPNGVLLLDADDRITWCNPEAADLLGLNPRRDRGLAVTNLVRAPSFVAMLQGDDGQDPVVFTTRGGELTVQAVVRPYGAGQKLVVTQDITERLRADAMRRDFVANVSHEIRTPLTVLAGFVETMSSLPLAEGERQRVLVLMQQQTDRMKALVSDLLTLAQLEGSPRPPADRWVPLAPMVQRVLADVRSLSAGRHTITLDDDGGACQLAGTEAELVSAIANLATNAVRYTPEGGHISVSCRPRDDGALCLSVTDTGPGIAREHLPRLTERFYRVDPGRARETGGTGLGLAIVKHVMQRHGGSLEIDSVVGKGSTFKLVFAANRVRQADLPMAARG